jgi:hypothetical protein
MTVPVRVPVPVLVPVRLPVPILDLIPVPVPRKTVPVTVPVPVLDQIPLPMPVVLGKLVFPLSDPGILLYKNPLFYD